METRAAPALVGLAGAVLAGVGDVLILGRGVSGAAFDQGAGVIPPQIEPVDRWRSLWNGAVLPRRRVHAGTLGGAIGIGLVGLALRGVSRAPEPGPLRKIATGSAVTFAVSGTVTHLSCGAVILAYERAATGTRNSSVANPGTPHPTPTSATRLLAVSAIGTLGSLAVLSADLAAAAVVGRSSVPRRRAALTPFPFVLATLATFGRLPAPVGGYARPASISIGLALYFLVTATASAAPDHPPPAE